MLLLGIGIADDLRELADWRSAHNHLIRSLPAEEQARVIAAKDRRKEELQ